MIDSLMRNLNMQAIANLPTWLNMAGQVYAPDKIVLVGAGNGTGPLVQSLFGLKASPLHINMQAHLIEADPLALSQLAKKLDSENAWVLGQEVVLPDQTSIDADFNTYYQYSLGTESGLLPPGSLKSLWPNIQLRNKELCSNGILLSSLLPASWLMIDCLPAANLIQGVKLEQVDLLMARVVFDEIEKSPLGSSLFELDEKLSSQGFKLYACFTERNTSLGKALWLRDSAKQLEQAITHSEQQAKQLDQNKAEVWQLTQFKAELQAKLDAEVQSRAQEVQALRLEKEALEQDKSNAQENLKVEINAKNALQVKIQELEQQQVELVSKKLELEKVQEQTTQQIKELQDKLEQARVHSEQQAKELEQEKAEVQQLTKLKADLQAKLEVEVQNRARELQATQAELALVKTQAQKQAQEQTKQIDQAQQKIEQTQAELQSQHIDSDALKKIKEEWAEVNKNPYAHNRILTSSLNASLREFTTKNLGLHHVKPAYIDYLAVKAQQIEKNCVGRLATTVQDAVTRQLLLECLSGDKAYILEIGALYGIGLAMLYNHATTRFQDVKLVCLDPFDGYYGKAVDALLNQPVNDLTFQRNMKLANVPDSDYVIIKRYSTDPHALQEAGDHIFNVLVIDGDHSYEGVKFDFENYFPLLEKGGYVILDDYNAKEWPGVQQFVDEDLKKHANFQYLGAFSRTAIGRKLY